MASGGVPETAICSRRKTCSSHTPDSLPLGGWARLNQKLYLTPKILYMCASCLTYAFYVFRMDFYEQCLGMGPRQSGLVHSVWSVASFVGISVWGNLADARRIHRPLTVALCIAAAVAFEGVTLKNFLPQRLWIYLALIVFSLHGLMMGGVSPLIDDQILKMLKYQFGADISAYGRQLIFGTVAYGIVTYVLGWLIALNGAKIMLGAVPLAATLCVAAVLTFGQDSSLPTSASMLMGQSCASSDAFEKSSSSSICDEIIEVPYKGGDGSVSQSGSLPCAQDQDSAPEQEVVAHSKQPAAVTVGFREYLKNLGRPRFLALLVTVLASGFGRQTLAIFLPRYLTTDLGLTTSQVGDAYLFGSAFSIIFYYLAPTCLRRLGLRPMLLIGQTALVVRLVLYSFTSPSNLALIFIEPLNGLSYAFTHVAAVHEASECAPMGWGATFQAAYGCMHVQFPAVFCSLVGGWLYEKYDGRTLMMLALTTPTVSVISIAAYLIYTHWLKPTVKATKLPT